MDILYIVGRDSLCDDAELRWSLRSLDTFGRGMGRIYVCGECPDWLSEEVIKIPCDDINKDTNSPLRKAQNIAHKLLWAIDNSDIEDDFLVSMDDHFYVKKTNFNNYPYYVKMTDSPFICEEKTKKMNEYSKFIVDCGQRLKELGLPAFYFTLHRNIRTSRTIIAGCRNIIEENMKNNYPMEVFVLLGNWAFVNGLCIPTFVEDNRVNSGNEWWKTSPDNSEVFSTAPFTYRDGLYVLMSGKYPNKSKYEK